MNGPDNDARGQLRYREMRPAHLRDSGQEEHVRVVFLESARFYTLRRDHPDFERALGLLKDAVATRRVLTVGFGSLESDTIEDVQEPG